MGQHSSSKERPVNPDELINFAYSKSPNRAAFDFFQLVNQNKDTESLEAALDELELLAKENQEHVVESIGTGPRGQYLNSYIVEAIMRLCDRFNVTDHVKFHSLELYNRWMDLLAADLRLYTKKRRKYHVKDHKRNMTLVMASCIQLASKCVGRQPSEFYEMRDITDNGTEHIMVSAYAILRLFNTLHPKLKYDLDDIIQSECVVFRRFSFNLKATSVMEIVESIIVLFVQKATELQKIYALCLIAVDFYYLRKAEIFGEYQKIMLKKGIKMNNHMFNRHQSDYVFIAVSIIHLIISEDSSPKKPSISLLQLQWISSMSPDEIAFLASAFAKFLLVKDDWVHFQKESSAAPDECERTK